MQLPQLLGNSGYARHWRMGYWILKRTERNPNSHKKVVCSAHWAPRCVLGAVITSSHGTVRTLVAKRWRHEVSVFPESIKYQFTSPCCFIITGEVDTKTWVSSEVEANFKRSWSLRLESERYGTLKTAELLPALTTRDQSNWEGLACKMVNEPCVHYVCTRLG